MFARFRPRLNYANVMATVAMFIALGGTSYAAVQLSKNSVRSQHIKNGEVKRADIANNAVNAAKVANGSLLPRHFKPGQMPAGPAGPKGDPGATNVTVRTSDRAFGKVTAHCAPGERATGGGGHTDAGYLDRSAPEPSTGAPTGWTAWAEGADVTAFVVCASP